MNDDVTGGGMTSQGGSASDGDDVTGVHNSNPLLGYIKGIDGENVPVYYSESMISALSSQNSVFSQNVNILTIDPYIDMGAKATDLNSDDNLTGVIVGPIVQHGKFTGFHFEPIYGEGIGESSSSEKDVSDHDQQGGSISKDL